MLRIVVALHHYVVDGALYQYAFDVCYVLLLLSTNMLMMYAVGHPTVRIIPGMSVAKTQIRKTRNVTTPQTHLTHNKRPRKPTKCPCILHPPGTLSVKPLSPVGAPNCNSRSAALIAIHTMSSLSYEYNFRVNRVVGLV